jgi:hypothetical protein
MSDLVAQIAGHFASNVKVSVPNVGPWFVDVDLLELVPLADLGSRVTLTIGTLELKGTIDPEFSGTFGQATKLRIVAGGGGWAKLLAAKPYHNDAGQGVKALQIATDAAREAGEVLGNFVPSAERVGRDFVRGAGLASQTLELALDGAPWHVDYAGITHGGPRPTPAAPAGSYELLEFDPRTHIATLAVDDLTVIGIGTILSDRLDAPQTVRELEIVMSEGSLRVVAWCGGAAASRGRLEDLLVVIARRALGGKLFGKYRYRLQTMAADGRVNLQVVSKADGLPNILPISMKPGVSGWHAELVGGTEVLVEFIGGEPTDPIVTGFPGKGEPGLTPLSLSFGDGTAPIARVGDTINCFFPPTIPFSGTIAGSPVTGVMTIAGASTGIIQTGRSELKA